MAQTIRRGGKGVRRATATRGAQARVATARKQTGQIVDRAVRWLPFSDETLYRILLAAILGGAGILAITVARSAGVPALAEEQVAAISRRAGFEVRDVVVTGTKAMDARVVYERALGQRDQAMSRLDLAGLRANLLDLPWVKDARVSRQLPDRLVIDIVERKPHAVLRDNGRLELIDETGHVLEAVGAHRAKGLLVLSGAGAQGQVMALGRLLDTAPALKPKVTEAEWIGNRRWNLTFNTGQVVALPEGDDESAAALLTFARMDGTDRLLGGKVQAFDMRASDKIYFRIPGHADEVVAEARAEAGAKASAEARDSDTRPSSPNKPVKD